MENTSPPYRNSRQNDAELFQLLADNAREMVSRHTFDLTFLYASPAASRVLGYPADKLTGLRLDDLVHPDDLAGLVSCFALARDAQEVASTTMRIKAAEGGWRWCEAYCRGVSNAETGESEIQASIRDISKYKQIEKAIERVAKEWRSTFDAAQDAILMLDRQARVIRVNLATTRLLDADFPELLGQPLKSLVKDRLGIDDPFGIDQIWTSIKPIRRDVQLPDSKRWLRSTIDPVVGTGDAITGAIVFLSDISKEKRAEVRLREALTHMRKLSSHLHNVREEERKSIAREVHDELGHALTALKMEVSWVTRRLEDRDEQFSERAAGMNTLIDQTIATVRRISTALRPPVLDDLGLDAAIEWLAQDYQGRTDIKTRVRLPENPDQIRSSRASSVFRIVQEALTNVARHSNASEVEISWTQDNNNIELVIADNGKGFTTSQDQPGSGFGLLGMTERARDLGGALKLDSSPGRGTRVRLKFPRKAGQ